MGGTSPKCARPSPTASPTPPRSVHDGVVTHLAAVRPPRRRRRRHAARAGVVEQDKVAQYLYNCPEYLESVFAAFKAGLAGQHQLPLRRRRARLPVGQRRRRRRRVPRRVRRPQSTRSAAASRASARGCGSTTAPARARTGRSPTRTPSPPPSAGRTVGPWGRSGDHLSPLHRRHDRHAEGRDVAPGRPVRRSRRRPSRSACRRSRTSTRFAGTSHQARARATCRPRRSCTAPGCSTPSAT